MANLKKRVFMEKIDENDKKNKEARNFYDRLNEFIDDQKSSYLIDQDEYDPIGSDEPLSFKIEFLVHGSYLETVLDLDQEEIKTTVIYNNKNVLNNNPLRNMLDNIQDLYIDFSDRYYTRPVSDKENLLRKIGTGK